MKLIAFEAPATDKKILVNCDHVSYVMPAD